MNYVYVLGPDGKPLMPTTRYGKVRRMLKSGQAVPVTTVPFTIQLTYTPQTSVCQPVTAGFDPGRTNIGISAVRQDGRYLYLAHCETRNKDKKYGGTSVLNQVVPSILVEFEKRFPGHTYATNGQNTKQFRYAHGLEKSHATDAYCIAASILTDPVMDVPDTWHEIVQFRRHNRAGIQRQTSGPITLGRKLSAKTATSGSGRQKIRWKSLR